MDPLQRFFPCNDLLEILEDSYEDCSSRKDDMYRQIALVHLLVGYPNKRKEYCLENVKINYWILKYEPIIAEYKKKYCL